jgi:hypothetical protein
MSPAALTATSTVCVPLRRFGSRVDVFVNVNVPPLPPLASPRKVLDG